MPLLPLQSDIPSNLTICQWPDHCPDQSLLSLSHVLSLLFLMRMTPRRIMLSQLPLEEIACLREYLFSLALGRNGSLLVASNGTVFHGREKPRLVPFSLSPVSDVASRFPFRHGLLLSQHWKGCLQSTCHGSPWRKSRKGRPSKRSADGSRGTGAGLQGRMKLCVPRRERWAPCRRG